MPHRSRPVVRSALALGASLAGVLPLAAPAAADVSISPTTAAQGDAVSVTFHVRNARAGAHTVKVEVDLPADAPIAEVYPMTVPDWAPKIVTRSVQEPLPGIHGSGLTEATSAIIWDRATDAPQPPAEETLRLEMGPMPQTDQLVFTVVQTYSDGVVQRWQGRSTGSNAGTGTPGGGTVLTLTPADPATAGGHTEHDGEQGAAEPATTVGAVVPTTSASGTGPQSGITLLDVGVGGGLAVGVVFIVMLAARGSGRDRRRGSGEQSPSDIPTLVTDPEEPAGGEHPTDDAPTQRGPAGQPGQAGHAADTEPAGSRS
jgi:uncharacterized protein YcnI